MEMFTGSSRHPGQDASGTSVALAACLALAVTAGVARGDGPINAGPGEAAGRYPTVPPGHKHVRALLDNAMRFVAAENGLSDPATGYPFEGWNADPKRGVFLRSFTQLTAIGLSMELLANVVAGQADSPGLSRDRALAGLKRLVETLRRDQRDPNLAAKGLLVNFLDFAADRRVGPLSSEVERRSVVDAFGPARGEAIWKALQARGWITPRSDGREAEIKRDDKFGLEHFDGDLAPFADDATRRKVMEILDRRVVLVVFGDNANLTASAAKTIGALLLPEVAGRAEVVAIRRELEAFLDDQREGYAYLYDARAGLFDFGWNATRDRLFGWEDAQGRWTTGHMDYFVNEFRGPATFVAARFGIPADAVANLGFKLKPYRTRSGGVLYALAPWEGSAFQAMGLGLSLGELDRPVWHELLGNVVAAEIDFAARKDLPGFLSESYTGDGTRYTGTVGIPELTVSPRPRITDAASLYSLGVAYSIAPEEVERFLGESWPVVSTLLTEHGPWEGYNVTKREAIRFQTSAHTLSLILGILATGSDHMKRYAAHRGIEGKLGDFFGTGEAVDLLSDATRSFAWADKDGRVESTREDQALRVRGERLVRFGIAFVAEKADGLALSGGTLRLRYRSTGAMAPVLVALKPPGGSAVEGLIPKEIAAEFRDTGGHEEELSVPLPATIGLMRVKEVVITHERGASPGRIDLTITRFGFAPASPGR